MASYIGLIATCFVNTPPTAFSIASIPKLGGSELVLESGDDDGGGMGEGVFGSGEWMRRGGQQWGLGLVSETV